MSTRSRAVCGLLFAIVPLLVLCTLEQSCARAEDDLSLNIAVDDSLAVLNVVELIDKLTDVAEYTGEFCEPETAFLVLDQFSNFSEDQIAEMTEEDLRKHRPPAVVRELVRRGVDAVPVLLDHLDDDRLTKLVLFEDDQTRVGDLCSVALGQIVNRDYFILKYGWGGGFVPIVEKPERIRDLRNDWRDLSKREHRQQLEQVAMSGDIGALERLCVYYPHVAERVALQRLARPLYDGSKFWDFLRYKLTAERDPAKWRPLIDEYVSQNGEVVSPLLPGGLNGLSQDTETTTRTRSSREKQAIAQRILRDLYPSFDPSEQAFTNAATIVSHSRTIESLRCLRSRKIDEAIHKVFLAAAKFQFAERVYAKGQGDAQDLDTLVVRCLRRFKGTEYEPVYVAYCQQRIAELERQPWPDKWMIDWWHRRMTGKPKHPPLPPEQRAAVKKLEELEVSVDEEYGEKVSDTQSEDLIPGPENPVHVEVIRLLAKLPQLKKFKLQGASITDRSLQSLDQLRDLRDINFARTPINGEGLKYLRNNSRLDRLILSSTAVTDQSLRHLRPLQSLRALSLAGCSITGQGLVYLRWLSRLEQLHLGDTAVDDAGLRHLKDLENLRELTLKGSRQITDAGMDAVAKLAGLQILVLDGTSVGDQGLRHLQRLPRLRELSIEQTDVSPQGVTELQATLPGLAVNYSWGYALHGERGRTILKLDRLTVVFDQVSTRLKKSGTIRLSGDTESIATELDVAKGREKGLNAELRQLMLGDVNKLFGRSDTKWDRPRFTVDYYQGVVDVEFSQATADKSRQTYKFSLLDNGTTLVCGGQKFDISDGKSTVVISPDGTARRKPVTPHPNGVPRS